MRVLATGDDHFDAHSRFAECIRVHAWMVDVARDAKIDLFLDGGDVYERASTAIERQAVADWLTPMAEVAHCLLVRGNHDIPHDVSLMRRLRTKHPIIVEEGAAVHHVAGAAVAAIAWPERAAILAAAGSIQGTEEGIREALRAVFLGLGGQLGHHDGPRLGLMHGMVDGSIASTNQPLLGLPINVSLSDLALIGAHLGIISHIHKAQRFQPPSGGPWMYAGASHRTDHSQLEQKSVVLAEFDGQRLVKVEEIPTPCTPMRDIESTYDEHSFDRLRGIASSDELAGAEVRWRITVPADQREECDRHAREWADRLVAEGAKSVKIEIETAVQTRARAPEVAAARGAVDKVVAHWGSVGFDPGDRRDPLLLKVAELEEEEARNAA
jgi:DNA repair exonuclease SbcCD nuclease subunit